MLANSIHMFIIHYYHLVQEDSSSSHTVPATLLFPPPKLHPAASGGWLEISIHVSSGTCFVQDTVVYQCCCIILRVAGRSALTEGCWIVVAWAHKSKSAKERHKLFCWALVHTLTLSQGVQMVKHLKQPGTWLVDGTDDCTATSSQWFQQWDTLEAGRAVQATEEKNILLTHPG
jgi:hypothetical protein